MNYTYTLGKVILVVAIVFAGYNELIDQDHIITLKKNMIRISKQVPQLAAHLRQTENLRYVLAGTKLLSSFLVFCDCALIV